MHTLTLGAALALLATATANAPLRSDGIQDVTHPPFEDILGGEGGSNASYHFAGYDDLMDDLLFTKVFDDACLYNTWASGIELPRGNRPTMFLKEEDAPQTYMEVAVRHIRDSVVRSLGHDPTEVGGGFGLVGMEWWTQCTHVGDTPTFHFDKDEAAVPEPPLIYPYASTVTYLDNLGTPTLILNQYSNDGYDHAPDTPNGGHLSFPVRNRMITFDGTRLHGVMPGHAFYNWEGRWPTSAVRRTLLVNLWKMVPTEPNSVSISAKAFCLGGCHEAFCNDECLEKLKGLNKPTDLLNSLASLPALWDAAQAKAVAARVGSRAPIPLVPFDASAAAAGQVQQSWFPSSRGYRFNGGVMSCDLPDINTVSPAAYAFNLTAKMYREMAEEVFVDPLPDVAALEQELAVAEGQAVAVLVLGEHERHAKNDALAQAWKDASRIVRLRGKTKPSLSMAQFNSFEAPDDANARFLELAQIGDDEGFEPPFVRVLSRAGGKVQAVAVPTPVLAGWQKHAIGRSHEIARYLEKSASAARPAAVASEAELRTQRQLHACLVVGFFDQAAPASNERKLFDAAASSMRHSSAVFVTAPLRLASAGGAGSGAQIVMHASREVETSFNLDLAALAARAADGADGGGGAYYDSEADPAVARGAEELVEWVRVRQKDWSAQNLDLFDSSQMDVIFGADEVCFFFVIRDTEQTPALTKQVNALAQQLMGQARFFFADPLVEADILNAFEVTGQAKSRMWLLHNTKGKDIKETLVLSDECSAKPACVVESLINKVAGSSTKLPKRSPAVVTIAQIKASGGGGKGEL